MAANSKTWASLWQRLDPEAIETIVSRRIRVRQVLAKLEEPSEPSPDFRSAFEGEEDAELYLDLTEVFAEQERSEGSLEGFEPNEPVTFFEIERSEGSDRQATVDLPTIDPLIDPD